MCLGSVSTWPASAIWDFIKARASKGRDRALLERELDAFLSIQGAHVRASTVIDAFARQGILAIKDTTLYAPNGIAMGAGPGATFSFGHDSVSRTDNTAIHTQGDARIEGSNAAIVQRDGSISFYVGGNGQKR